MNFSVARPSFKKLLFWVVALLAVVVGLSVNVQQAYREYPRWTTPAWYTLKSPDQDLWAMEGFNRLENNLDFEDALHHSRPGQGDRWGVYPDHSDASKVILRTATGLCAGQNLHEVIPVDCSQAASFTPEVDTSSGRTLVRFLDHAGIAIRLFNQDSRFKSPNNTWFEANRMCGTGINFPWVEHRCSEGFLWVVFGVASLVSVWFLRKCWHHMPRGNPLDAKRTTSRLATPFFWVTLTQLVMMGSYLTEVVADDVQVAAGAHLVMGIAQFCLAINMLHVSLEFADHPRKSDLLRFGYGLCLFFAVLFVVNPNNLVYFPGYQKGTAEPIHELRMLMGPIWSTADFGRSIALYLGFSFIFQNYPYVSKFFQRQIKWLSFMVLVPAVLSWLVWRFSWLHIPGLDVGYIISVTLPSFMMLVMFRWFDLRIFEVTSAPPLKWLIDRSPPLITMDRNGMVTWMTLQANNLFPETAKNLPLRFEDAIELAMLGDLPEPGALGRPVSQVVLEGGAGNTVILDAPRGNGEGENERKSYRKEYITDTGYKDVANALLLSDVSELMAEIAKTAYHRAIAEDRAAELEVKNNQLTNATSELKRKNEELEEATRKANEAYLQMEHLAVTDDLTRWGNRRRYRQDWEKREKEWCEKEFRDLEKMGLIYFDIDDFRKYNNENSHLVGDEILVQVAAHLSKVLGDHVGEKGFQAYRMSGEEFAVILPDKDLRTTFELAEMMRLSLRQQHFQVTHNDQVAHVTVTASFGVAAAPIHSRDKLLVWVDAAARRAKELGKDQVFVYPYWVVGMDF